MTVDPVSLVKRYHAALEPYEAQKVKSFFAEGAVYVSPGVNGTLTGREAIIAAFSAYFAEYPDQQGVDEDVAQTGPFAARSRWRLRATARSTGLLRERRGIETVLFNEQGLILRVEVEDA